MHTTNETMPRHLSRRDFLSWAGISTAGVLSGGVLLSSCGSNEKTASEGPAQVVTQFAWIKNVEYAGYYFADTDGLFAKQEVAPVLLAGGPNAAPSATVVAGGQADVGIVTDLREIIEAINTGSAFVIFATIYQRTPQGIMSLPGNPVRTAQDMIGKRIGSPAEQRPTIDALFKANGLPLDYKFVPVGFTADALVHGDVDALVVFVSDQPIYLKLDGVDYVLVSFDELNYPAYANLLFSKPEYIDANRDLLARYLRALQSGWLKNFEDPERGAELAVDKYGANLGLDMKQQIEANIAGSAFMQGPLTKEKGPMWISKDELEGPMFEALKASGLTDLPDVDKVLDLSILEAASKT